jgi:UDP-glucose 4-epimerase
VSNGSAVPLFMNQIENNQPITVTDPNMTRFFMSTKNAIDLVYHAFKNGENGDIFVRHEQPCKIGDLAQAVRVHMNCPNHPIQYIGARKGEKLHEKLITDEEFQRAICENNYIVIKNNGCKYNNNFTYSSDLIDPMNLIDIVNLIEKV